MSGLNLRYIIFIQMYHLNSLILDDLVGVFTDNEKKIFDGKINRQKFPKIYSPNSALCPQTHGFFHYDFYGDFYIIFFLDF